MVDDIVKSVDGERVDTTTSFIENIADHKGDEVSVAVIREEEGVAKEIEIKVVPRTEHPADQGPLGVAISTTEIYYPPLWQRPFIGIYYGFKEALFWLGFISLNLGIINLFPLPVLDGGHILFSIVEMITKKPIKAKTMERLILPFIVLLILFFIFVTYQDIVRIISRFF